MRAPGFFDLEERFAKLDEFGDPLKKIAESVNWEGFRAVLTDALSKPRKSKAGRKPGYCMKPEVFDFLITLEAKQHLV